MTYDQLPTHTAPPTTGRRPRQLLVAGVLAVIVLAAAAAAWLLTRPDDAAAPTTAAIAAAVDGRDYFVGTDLEPGVYRQASETPACAWRVSDPITDATIVEGRPGTGLATVNLGADTKFRADGCGPWVARP